MAEIVFLMRRKLSSKNTKVLFLTLSLAETLVKNGGMRVHAAFGTDGFMKDIAKIARKFNAKTGAENREVATLSLDIIQAWGEAFLPRQKQFPAFVKYYFELKKEGFPFSPQFDEGRVPIFTPASTTQTATEAQIDQDAILAAALAASLANEDTGGGPGVGGDYGGGSAYGHGHSEPGGPYGGGSRSSGPPVSGPGDDFLGAMSMSIAILKEMVCASLSSSELRENDVAAELALQLRDLHSKMAEVIEQALINGVEVGDWVTYGDFEEAREWGMPR